MSRLPRLIRSVAFAALALLTSGCALDVDYQRLDDHVIACDAFGQAYDPKSGRNLLDDALQQRIRSMLAKADGACADAVSKYPDRKRKLLIHVHGGLNSKSASLEAADRNIREMDHEQGDDWHYPIFVTWDSSFWTSWFDYIWQLRHGRRAKWWGPLTSPVYLTTDLARGAVEAPRMWLFQAGNDASVAAKVAFDWNLLPSWQNANTAYNALAGGAKDHVRSVLGDYRRSNASHAGRSLLYFITFPFTFIATPFIGPGLGQGSWEGMQHAAANLFHKYDEFDLRTGPPDRYVVQSRLKQKPTGAFAMLLRELATATKESDEPFEITIVCHSMGAIIVNDALRLLLQKGECDCGLDKELNITDLVYMAPACSVGDAAQAVVPYMQSHKKTQFHVLTLHPIAEAGEINFWDVPLRGSLLEWIDNYYVRATEPQERRLGKWNNIMQSLHLFRTIAGRMTVKGFGVESGRRPQKHGEFNMCPFWKKAFWDVQGPTIW